MTVSEYGAIRPAPQTGCMSSGAVLGPKDLWGDPYQPQIKTKSECFVVLLLKKINEYRRLRGCYIIVRVVLSEMVLVSLSDTYAN